jgi:hypothetical protein
MFVSSAWRSRLLAPRGFWELGRKRARIDEILPRYLPIIDSLTDGGQPLRTI